MTSVSHSSMSSLRSTLVVAHLQIQFTFMSSQLLLGECSFILISHLWTKRRPGELRMLLCLLKTESQFFVNILLSQFKWQTNGKILQFVPGRTSTTSLGEHFVFQTGQLFGRFLPLEHRTFWWLLGIVARFPSIESLCLALGFFSPILVSICWPVYTKRLRLSKYLHSFRPALFRPEQRKSSPKLLFLGPCCVAVKKGISMNYMYGEKKHAFIQLSIFEWSGKETERKFLKKFHIGFNVIC